MGEYNTIADADIDTDSPLDETLATALRDNLDYNYSHGIRVGTDVSGVRVAYARGNEEFVDTGVAANVEFTGSVTFSTDSTDGAPSFGDVPHMVWGLVSNEVTHDAWNAGNTIYAWGVVLTALSSSGFSWRVQFWNGGGEDIRGYLFWYAVAPVTAGE